jgi:hypothetical protein
VDVAGVAMAKFEKEAIVILFVSFLFFALLMYFGGDLPHCRPGTSDYAACLKLLDERLKK